MSALHGLRREWWLTHRESHGHGDVAHATDTIVRFVHDVVGRGSSGGGVPHARREDGITRRVRSRVWLRIRGRSDCRAGLSGAGVVAANTEEEDARTDEAAAVTARSR